MRAPAIVAATVLLTFLRVQAATVTAPHVQVTYNGIDQSQASAIAQTLSAAWSVYADDFGFDMPEIIKCEVNCAPGNTVRLFTDGNDGVFMYLASKSQLAPPGTSGIYTIYGLCHELGHIAMYRIIKPRAEMTTSAATTEGWAFYAGSAVVDRIYEMRGESLWPEAYDYREDGIARLERALRSDSPPESVLGGQRWRELEQIVGRKNIPRVFRSIQDAKVGPAGPSEAVAAALAATFPEKKEALDLWWKTSAPLLLVPRTPTSNFKPETVELSALTGETTVLELDDGQPDGRRSIAGGGHARKFSVPAGPDDQWCIVAVWVFGARYGPAQVAPDTVFDLALCDVDFKLIESWRQPFSAFDRTPVNKWVRIALPPTKVPADFSICLNFRPTATNGVYIHFDSSQHGSSFNGLPGRQGSAFNEGEWMIRVELDRLKPPPAGP